MHVLVSLSFTRLAKVLVDKLTLVFINKKVVLALHPNETFFPISIPLLETSLW
jgi:hypothetical protein